MLSVVCCPSCKEEFDSDEHEPIFKLETCDHYVCYRCSYDHIGICKEFWSIRPICRG